jgi:hypothetical protein
MSDMKLYAYSCGCIGFAPVDSDSTWAVIINACDGDTGPEEYNLHRRNMEDKAFKPLDEENIDHIIVMMNRQLVEGAYLREIRHMLRDELYEIRRKT